MISDQQIPKDAGPFRVIGRAKTSAWGKVGKESRIFTMTRGSGADACLAEYWLGAHHSMPSEVHVSAQEQRPLNAFLKDHGAELLGGEAARKYASELPFLLKVLSINGAHGLSIQAHPDAGRARRLHALDPKNYPDPYHKPEIGLPLTSVTLLYGFKPVAQLREVLARLPVLKGLLGDVALQLEGGDLYRLMCASLFSLKAEEMGSLITEIARATQQSGDKSLEAEVFHRLRPQYGDADPGLAALFLMNVVTIEPGVGIFIPANLPHAYLAGDLVECMACSDNVVRGGLTPKFKDVPALLEMITYDPVTPQPIAPVRDEEGFLVFPTPCSEFEVGYLPVGHHERAVSTSRGARVLMSLGNSSEITSVLTGKSVHLSDGEGALLPVDSGEYKVRTDEAAMYRASIGHE